MDNYYKTSKNIGNILNYYEFHNQFIKSKKRYKYIKEEKAGQRKITDYEIFINQKAEERREINASRNIGIKHEDIIEQGNYNMITEDSPKYRKKINVHMRKALLRSIKDEGLYSDTEEESEGDSNGKDSNKI